MPPSVNITPDSLRFIATSAVSDYLAGSGSLTAMVVKTASASGLPLTSEHLRRVCEMTYHDAFERLHRASTGPDRYVSFDPPDATEVVHMMRAEKVAGSFNKTASIRAGGNQMDKTASASNRYVPRNAFAEMTKGAQAAEIPLANPYREVHSIRSSVKEAQASLRSDVIGCESRNTHETWELLGLAKQAAVQNDIDVSRLLHAASSHVPGNVSERVVGQLFEEVALRMVREGIREQSKTASVELEVNADHPLVQQFNKVASVRQHIIELRLALAEINEARNDVDRACFGV